MRIGLEFKRLQDERGRSYYRVAPYYCGTERILRNLVIATLLIVTASVFLLLVSSTPDPIIKPTVTVLP